MLTFVLAVAGAAAAVAAVGGAGGLRDLPGVAAVERVAAHDDEQGASQISAAEFLQVQRGIPSAELRALVGEPEDVDEANVEGVELECWYYGVVGASGAFQFCFADDRLVSRFRFSPAAAQ